MSSTPSSHGSTGEELLQLARDRVRADAQAVESIAATLDASFLHALDLVAAAPGKVVVVGVGTSGPIARRMAHLLSTSGTPSLFLHPADALHGSLGAITAGDVVIAISKGGRSSELNDFAALAQARGADLLCVTSAADSPIAQLADLAVVLPQTEDADPGGIIAMGSSLAVAAWGDALALALRERSGYSWEEILRAHPSGAVGRLAAAQAAAGGSATAPGGAR